MVPVGGYGHALVVVPALSACTRPASAPVDPASSLGTPGNPSLVLELTQPRAVHRAIALSDGRVLLTGGCTAPGCEGFAAGRVSELFDPGSNRLTVGPSALTPRASGTATLLADGRVLLTGGYPGEGRPPMGSVEVFDPESGRFAPFADLVTARAVHTATAMADGRVLVAGGYGPDGAALRSTEIFDPQSGRFAAAADLPQPRAGHAAVSVNHRVVLIGGTGDVGALASSTVWERGVGARPMAAGTSTGDGASQARGGGLARRVGAGGRWGHQQ